MFSYNYFYETINFVNDAKISKNDIMEASKLLSEVNSMSTFNAKNVEEIATTAEHLNDLTEQLTDKLEYSKT
ncbi:MAG: hypothetical protein R3331_12180 [Sulfurospirillaceae bacterium]|nr:hypothetical protein [Sulfurospirillaceae bacterium]